MLKADLAEAISPTESIQDIHIGDIGTTKTFLRPVGHADFKVNFSTYKLEEKLLNGELIESSCSRWSSLGQKHTKNS